MLKVLSDLKPADLWLNSCLFYYSPHYLLLAEPSSNFRPICLADLLPIVPTYMYARIKWGLILEVEEVMIK